MYHYLIIIFLGGDRYEKVDTGISGMPANKIPNWVNYNFFFFLKVVISSAAVVGSYRSYFIFYFTTLAFGSNESFCYVFLVSAYIRKTECTVKY